MYEIKITKKATLRYKLISYFVTKMPRLKIYQNEQDVIDYVSKIQKEGKTPENFKHDAKFLAPYTKEIKSNMLTYTLNPDGENLIVYLHGGAFINRPTKHHMNFASKIALATNSKVLVPYYPLAPFHTVSESIDALVAFIRILKHDFVLLGDSAGGGLCFGLLYALQKAGLEQKVKSVVSVSPWLDMTTEGDNIKDRMLDKKAVELISKFWEGDLDKKHPYCSPCFAKFEKPYSALVIVGGKEILHKDTTLFVNQNRNQDVIYLDYQNLEHDFPLYPVPETKHAIEEIVKYINWFNQR